MLKEKEINGRKYHLVAKSWRNSRGWGHECDLYIDGDLYNTVRIRYYNRTWEAYPYQSVMIKCLESYRNELLDRQDDRFREKFNVKRMTKKLRESYKAWLGEQYIMPVIKGLENWIEEL